MLTNPISHLLSVGALSVIVKHQSSRRFVPSSSGAAPDQVSHWAMIKRWEQPQQWGGCYWEYCDKWRRDVTDITCHDGHDCHAIIIASAPGLHGITISILTK